MGVHNYSNSDRNIPVSFSSAKDIDKAGLILFADNRKTKIGQLTGDLVDIAMRSFEYEGKANIQYVFVIKDIDTDTGAEELYDLQFSEGSMLCSAILNMTCNLKDTSNLEFSYYIKDEKYVNPTLRQAKSPINWADRAARNSAQKIEWKYKPDEIPKVEKEMYKNNEIIDDSKLCAFWRKEVATFYKNTFGKEWEFYLFGLNDAEKTSAPPVQPAPQPPTNEPPKTAPASQGGIIGEDAFSKMLQSIVAQEDYEKFSSFMPRLYKRAADLGATFTKEQLAAILVAVKSFATKVGMLVDEKYCDVKNCKFHLYVEDLPF